jgi:hypothetical protein
MPEKRKNIDSGAPWNLDAAPKKNSNARARAKNAGLREKI